MENIKLIQGKAKATKVLVSLSILAAEFAESARSAAARKCVNLPLRISRVGFSHRGSPRYTIQPRAAETPEITLAFFSTTLASSFRMLSRPSSLVSGAPRSPATSCRPLKLPGSLLSHTPMSSRTPSSGYHVAQHRPAIVCRFKVSSWSDVGPGNSPLVGHKQNKPSRPRTP